MADQDYKDGARAAIEFYNSVHFVWVVKPVLPEDAMRLFLPPVEQQMMQVQTPMPKPRKDWLKGFKEEQENILRELSL